jgi:vacuolar-type H+-ATPase subunit C/Vma6
MMQKPGVDTRYIYAVARVRVLETRLLGDGAFERLVEQETISDVIKVLGEFQEYAEASSLSKDGFDVERLARGVLRGAYELAGALLVEKALLEPFYVKAEVLDGTREVEASSIDSMVYGAFFERWKDNLFLNGYIKTAIDLENIKAYIRAKGLEWPPEVIMRSFLGNGRIPAAYFKNNLGVPLREFFNTFEYHRYDRALGEGLDRYEKDMSLSHLERLCDDMLIDYLRPAKYLHFGAEPVVSYVLAKEFEVKNVRAIVVGKANGFKDSQIRAILRRSYV